MDRKNLIQTMSTKEIQFKTVESDCFRIQNVDRRNPVPDRVDQRYPDSDQMDRGFLDSNRVDQKQSDPDRVCRANKSSLRPWE